MTAADTILDVDVMRCPECGARFGVDAAFCPFDGVPLVAATWDKALDPLRGRVIDDRYEVLELLGEGGMGSVYRVRHVTLDRHFALKILRRELAADAALAARFVREARATAAVRHPAVVAITDFGELDGIPWFVMELLIGETLAVRLRGRGRMEPLVAARIGRLVAEALEASHLANVIHRDLKPENVFLVGAGSGRPAEGEIRIVDFGAAKIVGASKLTRPGIVFGTPYYMSPEQANGQQVDGRSDVYSLGVLLYEMVTGALPFEADTYMGVLTKHIFEVPERPSARLPPGVVLGELDHVIMTALAKEPSARFATMGAVARALADLERGAALPLSPPSRGPLPRSTVPLAGGIGAPVMSTADRIEAAVGRRVKEETSHRRKRIALFGGLAAAALASAVMAGGALLGNRDRREAGVASAPATSLSLASPASATVEEGARSTSAIAVSIAASAVAASPPPGSSSSEPVPSGSALRADAKPRSSADASRNTAPPSPPTPPSKPSGRGAPSSTSERSDRGGSNSTSERSDRGGSNSPSSTSERGALNPENFKDPWAR